MSKFMNDRQQALFAQIAEELIPTVNDMPGASQAHVPDIWADEALNLRMDLREDFFRGLRVFDATRGGLKNRLAQLQEQDAEAFNAVGVITAGAYFLNPDVRHHIGYPGQQTEGSYVTAETTEYVQKALEPVLKRGSIYRQA